MVRVVGVCYHEMSESDVLGYFEARHITLKKEWMQSAIGFIKYQEKGRRVSELCEAVMEQLIYSDLRDSYQPWMKIPTAAIKAVIVKRMLFQVVSVINIARSAYELYREKTNTKDSISWFDGNENDFVNSESLNSRRMLKVRLTDGSNTLDATEYGGIIPLTENTLPGTKILLTSRVICRRGIMLLNESNCQIIGGEVESLVKEWDLSATLGQKIGIKHRVKNNISTISPYLVRIPRVTASAPQNVSSPDNSSQIENIKQNGYSANPMFAASISSVKLIDEEDIHACSPKKLGGAGQLFKELDKPMVTVLPQSSTAVTRKESKLDITSAQELEIITRENRRPPNNGMDSRMKDLNKEQNKPGHRSITEYFTQMFRSSSTPCEESRDRNEDSEISTISIHPIPVVPLEKQQLKVHISEHIHGHSSVDSQKRSCSPVELITAIVPLKKTKSNVKIDEVMSLPTSNHPSVDQTSVDLEFPSFPTQLSTAMTHEHIAVIDPMLLSPHSNDTSIVEGFLRLNIMRLADVLIQKKFWMLPRVVNITGICRVSIDLRAENNQWLLFVFVCDESLDQLKCQVASVLLEKLLGFSVKYCQNLSAAKDKAELMRCKERAIEVMRSLQRLDLIFSIEMPTQKEKIPVVINVKTLSEALQLC